MPHKAEVARALDRLAPVAAALGVANTVSWVPGPEGPQLVGDSTDGAGFLDALRGDEGFDPAGQPCVVLGAGGAARAVTLALAGAGAQSITVAARRADQAAECADLAGPLGRPVPAGGVEMDKAVRSARLVVNATPTGMTAGDGLPLGLDPEAIDSSHYVADLIYAPARTALLGLARERGAGHSNGLGMLIHQAARQVELWTGRPAPLEAMSAAALAALSHPSP
jgi:shikimate dehydrogenase